MTQHIEGGRKAISIRFDPHLLKLIDALAKRLKTNRSQLLEDAAARVLRENGVDPDKGR